MGMYFTYGTHASPRDLITSTTHNVGQHRRYFSSIDAEVFIGGERLIDIVRIDYSYEEKKLPVYGYNSYHPSNIFAGQKIVSGSFAVNFVETGYIANIIANAESSVLYKGHYKGTESCNGKQVPLFKNEVDIMVGYGGWNTDSVSFKATHQILEGVNITGYRQVLDVDGEPIYEIYTFMAKSINMLNEVVEGETSTSVQVPDNPESDNEETEEEENDELTITYSNSDSDSPNDKNDVLLRATTEWNENKTLLLSLTLEGERSSEITTIYITSNSVDFPLRGTVLQRLIDKDRNDSKKLFYCSFDFKHTNMFMALFKDNRSVEIEAEITINHEDRVYKNISISSDTLI